MIKSIYSYCDLHVPSTGIKYSIKELSEKIKEPKWNAAPTEANLSNLGQFCITMESIVINKLT